MGLFSAAIVSNFRDPAPRSFCGLHSLLAKPVDLCLSRNARHFSDLFQPLEDAIRLALLSALVHRDVNDLERIAEHTWWPWYDKPPTQSSKAANVNSL